MSGLYGNFGQFRAGMIYVDPVIHLCRHRRYTRCASSCLLRFHWRQWLGRLPWCCMAACSGGQLSGQRSAQAGGQAPPKKRKRYAPMRSTANPALGSLEVR